MDADKRSSASILLERAREVAKIIKRDAGAIEAGRQLTPEVRAAMHDAGLFRILLPKSLGGAEIDLVTLAEVAEIISSADASTAWCLGQGSVCGMSAAFLEPEPARRLFGPRDAVLAWGAGIQGTAIEVPGGYRITGRWSFASGSRNATLLGAHCYVVSGSGEPRLKADGRKQ
ncbi:MAG: acyl-CoA dehydrogenase family protein, partial [Proteobacteria bacterium]|nr:acyl-CoA dehydrogenase family protein [Pseudomonadota bacterium]